MSTYSPMHCDVFPPTGFPEELANVAFRAGDEVAWSPDLAALAVEWFGSHGYAILGTELWVLQIDGIQSLPMGKDRMRGVYGNTVDRQKDELWDSFVQRSATQTQKYLQSFIEQGKLSFNVTWISEQGYEELLQWDRGGPSRRGMALSIWDWIRKRRSHRSAVEN